MSSMSDPRAMMGLPSPQVARNAVGIPATPRSILKPAFSKIPVRYLDVSNSWKPSSPKLKTVSTITWAFFFMPSIWPARPAFIALALAGAIWAEAETARIAVSSNTRIRFLLSIGHVLVYLIISVAAGSRARPRHTDVVVNWESGPSATLDSDPTRLAFFGHRLVVHITVDSSEERQLHEP